MTDTPQPVASSSSTSADAARVELEALREMHRKDHSKLGDLLLDKTSQGVVAANWQGGRVNGIGEGIIALQRLVVHLSGLPQREVGRVAMKSLEWETAKAFPSIGEPREHYGFWPGGYYHVGTNGRVWAAGTFDERGQARHIGFFGTIEAAKAAAQADVERRVLSCLAPTLGAQP